MTKHDNENIGFTPVSELKWLFFDLNSYFASVEQQDSSELRGKPIAIVPMMTDSTCAIAASYEAKAHGIKTGIKKSDTIIIYSHFGKRKLDITDYNKAFIIHPLFWRNCNTQIKTTKVA